MEKIIIVGGGSLLGNLINYITSMNTYEIVGYTDILPNNNTTAIPYLGNDSTLPQYYKEGVRNACIGVGNRLNDSSLKQKISTRLKDIGFKLPIIKGQNVIIHNNVSIGEGTIIRDAAIIQSNCVIGSLVMIGDNVVISHDTSIGNNSQIVTGCVVGRGVKIGDNVFIGFSSVITNDLIINDDCII